jgi:hypothetical protein
MQNSNQKNMSDNAVFGITNQQNSYKTYVPTCHNCAGGGNDRGCKCTAGWCSVSTSWDDCRQTNNLQDWFFDEKNCCSTCPYQPQCSKPDPNACQVFGKDFDVKNLKVDWKDNNNRRGMSQDKPPIRCQFKSTDIVTNDAEATERRLAKWLQVYGPTVYNNDKTTSNPSYDEMMTTYCSQETSNSCMVVPMGNGQTVNMPKCTRLRSFGTGGDMCRRWWDSAPAHVRDPLMKNYCIKNNDSTECLCVNREQKVDFQAIQQSGSVFGKAACWWVGCQNPATFFIPSDQEYNKKDCPDVCQTVLNIYDNINTNISDLKQNTTCVKKTADPPNNNNNNNPGTNPTPPPPAPAPSNNGDSSSSSVSLFTTVHDFFVNHKQNVGASFFVAAALVIIILATTTNSGKKK